MEAYYSYNQTAFCMGANWNKKAFVLIRWQLSRRWPLQTVLFVFVLVYNYLWLQDLAEILSEKFDLIDIDSVLLSHVIRHTSCLSIIFLFVIKFDQRSAIFCHIFFLLLGLFDKCLHFFIVYFFFNFYIFKGVGS